MKYILKNIKQFITKNTLVFSLYIFCQIISILILLLSYGVYMNYKENYDKELLSSAGLYDNGTFGNEGYEFSEKDWRYMYFPVELDIDNYSKTMEEIEPFFIEITDYFDKKLDYVELSFLPKRLTLKEIQHYANDCEASDPIEVLTMLAKHDGEYTFEKTSLPSIYETQGTLLSGRFFTDGEIQNGEPVCIANIESIKRNSNNKMVTLREENGETYVNVCAKEYRVIGTAKLSNLVLIPFINSPKNLYTSYAMSIKFTEPLTVEEHNKYVSLMKEYFGDMVNDEDLEVATVNIDKQYFYNTNIWLSVIIALAAAVNLAVLYRYVLMTRRKTLAIFRLVGAKKNKIRRIYIAETLGISVAVFALCAVLFNYAVLPWLIKYYPYCSEVYSLKVYGIMFLIYTLVSYIVLNIMIITHISKSPVKLLKEGR